MRNPPKRYEIHSALESYDAADHSDAAKFRVFASHVGIGLPCDFLSNTSFQFLRLWLDECVNEHAKCKACRQGTAQAPRRLIDVGDAFHEPHLVELSHEVCVDYVTLSYCWGKLWNSKTTKANIEDYKASIPMQDLSPTLRHAVLLTRHLKFQYLWVDSLCIIQDSKEDWDTESVNMAIIYQNSIFTIAVPGARSTMEGIIPEASKRQMPLTIRAEGTHFSLFIDSVPLSWDICVEQDALSERAWVLQERLMSCRIVFLGSQQMFWECKTKRASQHQYADLLEDKVIKKSPQSFFNKVPEPNQVDLLPLQLLEDDEERDYFTWYEMLSIYSSKDLTVPSDKLPALAGMAKAFQPKNSLYLAGTWLGDWRGGLLWHAVTPRSLRYPQNVRTPRAPSWSWAHLDGKIAFSVTCPDHKYSRKLRTGVLHPGEAETLSSAKVSPTRSENQTVEGKGKAAAKAGEQSREDSRGEARKLNDDGDVTGEGSKISLIMGGLPDRAGPGPQELIAELLDVSCGASDFLGKETSITLTIRSHAEWVVARSGTVKLEPPSTYNDWTGIYDDLTENWEYVLDQEAQEEPCKCLRLIICCTSRQCWALLLRQHPGSYCERIGMGTADSYLVDFLKLMEAPRETVMLC